MTALGHVSLFLFDRDKELSVTGMSPEWLIHIVISRTEARFSGVSCTEGQVCGCLLVSAGVNWVLSAGGKMKTNASKHTEVNIPQRIERKESKGGINSFLTALHPQGGHLQFNYILVISCEFLPSAQLCAWGLRRIWHAACPSTVSLRQKINGWLMCSITPYLCIRLQHRV